MKEVSAHGRFQPLHNGHMEYLLAAIKSSDFLFIGLTQPDIRSLVFTPGADHRALRYSNPLTYFERWQTIKEALEEEGVRSHRFAIIPFPIETPAKLPDFLPVSVECLTTVYEEWNLQKIVTGPPLSVHPL